MPTLPQEIIALLDACISANPMNRPDADFIANKLCVQLVKGQHKGIFTQNHKNIFELSSQNPNVGLKVGSLGELKVYYDGLCFIINSVSGSVFVNNIGAVVGMQLPATCVITFGGPELGSSRQWIPFASSHPEVIL